MGQCIVVQIVGHVVTCHGHYTGVVHAVVVVAVHAVVVAFVQCNVAAVAAAVVVGVVFVVACSSCSCHEQYNLGRLPVVPM